MAATVIESQYWNGVCIKVTYSGDKKVVAVLVNTAWNAFNFRSNLIKALLADGHDVVVIGTADSYVGNVQALGCRFIPSNVDLRGTNVIKDWRLFFSYWWLFKKIKADVILPFTIKPTIYGIVAARLTGAAAVANIAGLGEVFAQASPIQKLVVFMYRHSLPYAHTVFFQNEGDMALFRGLRLVDVNASERIFGSGVDLSKFSPISRGLERSSCVFLMVARLLEKKGVREYVDAARFVKRKHPESQFLLCGFVEAEEAGGVPEEEIKSWDVEGVIRFLGATDNVRDVIEKADCIVLPSYYPEGVPRSLLEAAASALPVITTDSNGCRDAVIDEVTGFLVSPQDVQSLASALSRMIKLGGGARAAMGRKGRALMLERFDEKKIVARYQEILSAL